MKLSPHRRLSGIFTLLLLASCLRAGETIVVSGYAQGSGPVLISRSMIQQTILTVTAAPDDRPFIPPTNVRWEVLLTGRDSTGMQTGIALRSDPDDFAWPAGNEMAPDRYNGSISGLYPSMNTLDPLNVPLGSGIQDYDGDGVPDKDDAFPGDPKEWQDTDGDGIGDNSDPDIDGDGMPNDWEIAHGLNPFVNDAADDPDHDGFSNLAEYEAGTDPHDRSSFFRILSVVPAGLTVTVTFQAIPGRTYSILHSPGVSGQKLLVKGGITATAAGPMSVTVPKSSLFDFYYLQVSITP